MTLTKQDLDLRQTGLTGTDIVDLIEGRSMNVYLRKKGIAEDLEGEQLYWGNALEEDIAERFGRDRPEVVRYAPPTMRHRLRPWHLGTPDRLLHKRTMLEADPFAGLECKNRDGFDRPRWDNDGMPVSVELQCRWYMALVEIPVWYVAVLFGGNRYEERAVTRDLTAEGDLLTIAEDFLKRHVHANVPPAPDGSDAWARYIKKTWPGSTGEIRKATPVEEALVNEAKSYAEVEKGAKVSGAVAKQKLMALIGNDAGLELSDGRKVSRSLVKGHTRKPVVVEPGFRLYLPRTSADDKEE